MTKTRSRNVEIRRLKEQASALMRSGNVDAALRALYEAGCISWSGGKPRGLIDAPAVRGGSVADAVIEDRR